MDTQRLALLKRKLEALSYDGELDTKSAPLAEKVRIPPSRLSSDGTEKLQAGAPARLEMFQPRAPARRRRIPRKRARRRPPPFRHTRRWMNFECGLTFRFSTPPAARGRPRGGNEFVSFAEDSCD